MQQWMPSAGRAGDRHPNAMGHHERPEVVGRRSMVAIVANHATNAPVPGRAGRGRPDRPTPSGMKLGSAQRRIVELTVWSVPSAALPTT